VSGRELATSLSQHWPALTDLPPITIFFNTPLPVITFDLHQGLILRKTYTSTYTKTFLGRILFTQDTDAGRATNPYT
jgi:hypothetical protein